MGSKNNVVGQKGDTQVSNGENIEGLTLDQKFAKVMLLLKQLRPFYSSVYEVMDKECRDDIPTMGVTADKFLYNQKFAEDLPFDEFVFVVLHEIAHISLMHPTRINGRDPELWNIACDLYVNKLLDDEFNLGGKSNRHNTSSYAKMPESAVYWDQISVNDDAVDTIYDELYQQAKDNGYFDKISLKDLADALSNNNNGSNPGSNGNSNKSNDNSNGQQGQKQQGQKKSLTKKFTLRRNGKEWSIGVAPGAIEIDLVPGDGGKSSIEDEAAARKLLQNAQIRNALTNRSAGEGKGMLERLCEKMLESKLDWRKILRKYLINYTQNDLGFSKPDKRMYWQDAIYPGPIPGHGGKVRDVKVCIDTSGSISDEDFAEFAGHINKLLNQYKVDAELIYWDADIQTVGKFRNLKEFRRVSIRGGGGTDPSCVYEYFDKQRIKPVVTLMLTDGYFGVDQLKEHMWPSKYKDTIWIICKKGVKKGEFNPPFGKVTYAIDTE